ncbi:ABC transporter ATP-binding protein [Paenibacillus sp. OV219]|uniref:ABC transporter ATP-binding protein n=1 Tax=Paenibacillus sp. OV219 TaxID=1884377 RepID=UPI0008C93CA1|nr:ABC transporter ATP-binding protein [Paenibacillus sp. OV219]SEO52143.1 carbohydrate ABC transporter ATP-binding protein, CUT1 family [Paenibacillus sp. OV219]
MSAIQFANVHKTYSNGKTVIEGLNLEIRDRSFTVLVGPSGCGKTTALRMIAGLEEVTEGTIQIGNTNVTKLDPGERDVAMVFQNYAIYPHMSVKGNIEFGLKNQGMPKASIIERLKKVIHLVGLAQYTNAKPSMLSGGQRQRIALARAISKEPGVFLMDEPLSNLDAKLRNQMRSELIQLHQTLQSTFVFVTHDQIEAMTMATDIVIFNEGKVMQVGTPKQVYNDPDNIFVATFIGDPGMNIVKLGTACQMGFRPQKAKFTMKEQFQGISVTGEIVTSETLGLECLNHVKTNLGNMIVKSEEELDFGQNVSVYVMEEDLYFFDMNDNRIREPHQIKQLSQTILLKEGVRVAREHPTAETAI